MKLVGFNYTKLSAERSKSDYKDLKIESIMNIEKIEEISPNLTNSKDLFIKVGFNYSLNYNPGIAKIEIKGEIVLSIDSKLGKEILKNWKDKKVDEKIRIAIFNGILRKTNLKTLELEELLNLPFHFQLPSLKSGPKK